MSDRISDPPFEAAASRFGAAGAAFEAQLETRLGELLERYLASPLVHPPHDAEAWAQHFTRAHLPETPAGLDDYLEALRANVIEPSTHVGSPRFLGHMTSELPSFLRPLAKLVTALNQNPVKVETANTVTPLERQTLAVMHRLIYGRNDAFYAARIQDPAQTLGLVTGGGTVANLSALWIARNNRLGPRNGFAGVREEGLPAALNQYGFEGAVVVGSALMHYSLDKSADVLGLGRRGLIKVPVDAQHRIDLEILRKTLDELKARRRCVLALVGIAGSTDSGSVDPLPELADLAAEHGAHFHVDAAWGGAALCSDTHRKQLAGIERADSVTVDGHKQFYCPMGLGLLLLREPGAAASIASQAEYIIRAGSSDLGRRSLEGSRPAAVLYLHAILSLLGREGLGALIDRTYANARAFAARIEARPEFELLYPPRLNILLYRYVPKVYRSHARPLSPEATRAVSGFNLNLQETQRREGRTFVSRTSLDPARFGGGEAVLALRAVIANPLTQPADLDAVLEDQMRIGAALERA